MAPAPTPAPDGAGSTPTPAPDGAGPAPTPAPDGAGPGGGGDLHGDGDGAVRYLLGLRTWAVVGCSADPARPSHEVARALLEWGHEVVPVNPALTEILGRTCYPDLRTAARHHDIEVVDLFRRSEHVAVHVDEAIEVGARGVWMQLGVIDPVAAARARDAGLVVVMDRCPRIERPRLGVPPLGW